MIRIEAKPHDLGGGFVVHRVIPIARKRMVGPFCFLDHMGPVTIQPGQKTDVRPHPHIGLSTLTYLFEGRMVHHDSLDCKAVIVPGEVNWMTAGKGISHSERTHPEDREKLRRMEGLQFWVALPDGAEEIDPSFAHYEEGQIPRSEDDVRVLTLVAGEAFGLKSPVVVTSPLVFAEVRTKSDCTLKVDFPEFEIGIYVIHGTVTVEGEIVSDRQMAVMDVGAQFEVHATAGTQYVIIGGEPFTTPRHIWWNLVSSNPEKIEAAKKRWKDGTFPMVPGETEFIPLPDK